MGGYNPYIKNIAVYDCAEIAQLINNLSIKLIKILPKFQKDISKEQKKNESDSEDNYGDSDSENEFSINNIIDCINFYSESLKEMLPNSYIIVKYVNITGKSKVI